MILSTVNYYEFPDGRQVQARPAHGRDTMEWKFIDPATEEPLYLLDRDGETLLRFVPEVLNAHRYRVVPCALRLSDIRIVEVEFDEE